jgi:hypothetical protein
MIVHNTKFSNTFVLLKRYPKFGALYIQGIECYKNQDGE